MTLREVLQDVEGAVTTGALDVDVTGLCLDSRRVRAGDLFFGLAGLKTDGSAFARTALGAGAAAAVVDRGVALEGGTVVRVDEPRKALAQAACRFHGFPSRALRVFAVTGTNGKTTTTYLVHAVLEHAGLAAGLLGTTGVRLGAETRPSSFTTPEAPELQGLLREMAERGLTAVALEVSSHALAQRRAHGLEADVVAFTNLSHDHLDYHGTLAAYLDAKLMLFDGRNGRSPVKRPLAVVGLDDPAAGRVIEAARHGGLAVRTFGASHGADVWIREVAPREGGLTVTLLDAGETVRVELPLLGRYNAWNAACAYAATRALGLDGATVAAGLAAAPGVPGRLERVRAGQPFEVVVDYAHSPDALARALDACREHTAGRVLVVFGCGGDRDRAKRPVMGRLAAERADVAIVTSDNPRGEAPAAIAREILAGAPDGALRLELDRRAAIAAALAEARPGDLVLIAGKGHETTQTIGERVLPFDDRVVAREALAGGAVR
jgi:UDP-N-acetylmuramoyl-L-alanyl-D-glutamate--2,6-diaminopimelate ligase